MHIPTFRRLIRVVTGAVAFSVLALVLTFYVADPWLQSAHAQQQTTTVSTSNRAAAMSMTMTTSLTATATTMLVSGSINNHVVGNRNIYGYRADGAAGCYLQVFDRYAASAVTVGTTVPTQAFIVNANSSLGWTISSIPMFNLTSALTLAATTTQGGSTGCTTAPIVTFLYK